MAKANPSSAVPTLLLQMALAPLPAHVAALIENGENPSDYVWAYFDGRVRPGRSLAVMHMRSEGASLEQATRRVDAGIKKARAQGTIFAFGVMTTTRELVNLLRKLGGQEGVDTIGAWAEEPAPTNAFRVVVIAGATIQLQLVELPTATPT